MHGVAPAYQHGKVVPCHRLSIAHTLHGQLPVHELPNTIDRPFARWKEEASVSKKWKGEMVRQKRQRAHWFGGVCTSKAVKMLHA
jgi:hypothetical protein